MRVSKSPRKSLASKPTSQPRPRVAPHIAALPKSGIRDFFELVNTMDDVVSLASSLGKIVKKAVLKAAGRKTL